MMSLEAETLRCSDCRVWDPENQPSVLRALAEDPNKYKDRFFVTVLSGTALEFGGVSIPLWVEILTCKAHEQKWILYFEAEEEAKRAAM